jgi:hypothetical protein
MVMIPETFAGSSFHRSLGVLSRFQQMLRPPAFRAPRCMKPAIIGILGPSGVGKTTFFRHIRKGRPRPSFWATTEEALRARSPGKQRCFKADDRVLDLLQDRLELSRRLSVGKGDALRYVYNAFSAYFDEIRLETLDLPCHVVRDEGFFFAFRREILKHGKRHPELLAELVRNRAFVVLRCPPAEVAANLRRRAAAGGKLHAAHIGADAETLCARAEADARCIDELVALIRQAGRPVLELEAGDSYSANVAAFATAFD